MPLAVLVHLQFQHLLLADIVRHHPLGGAFGRQLRQVPVLAVLVDVVLLQHVDELGERRCDPHALLVLHALIPLEQHLLDDDRQIGLLLLAASLAQIHEHRDERRLSVGGQQRHHLILDGLHAAADLLPQALFRDGVDLILRHRHAHGVKLLPHAGADLIAAHLHEGRQMCQGDGLAAVLVGSHLCHDLGGDVAGGGEAVGPFDQGAGDDGAVLQHILQIHQIAVVHMLGIIVAVVEVDDTLAVRLHNILRQQDALAEVAADLAGHIVPLGGVDHRVLVGVLLLGLLVVALDEAQDAVVGRVGTAHQAAGVAVGDVGLGDLERAVGHDLLFDHVLNFFHGGTAAQLLAGELHALGNALDLARRHAVALFDGGVGLRDGHDDLRDVKGRLGAVALNDLHVSIPPPHNRKTQHLV